MASPVPEVARFRRFEVDLQTKELRRSRTAPRRRGVRAKVGTQVAGVLHWAGEAIADASGQFSFAAIEGFNYTVRDRLVTADSLNRANHLREEPGAAVVK